MVRHIDNICCLPITYKGEEKFLSSTSKIILDESSQVSCAKEFSIHSFGDN